LDDAIRIMDDDDEVEIRFSDVERYHGQHSIAGAALGFQVLRCALGALHPEGHATRGDVAIVSGHPGPGFRDAFELVTRAVTRGLYEVDHDRPDGRYNPFGTHAYSWSVTSAGRRADLVLRPDLIPHRFFELWNLLGKEGGDDVWPELVRVKRGVADTVLAMPLEDLFAVGLSAEPSDAPSGRR